MPALPVIEHSAAELFPAEDLPQDLRERVTPLEEFAAALDEGLLWAAVWDDGTPAGFALLSRFDDLLFIEELDVDPRHARRGIGRSLVEMVVDSARAEGASAVALITFGYLPWNAPFYASCGFEVISLAEAAPGLRQRFDAEAARGLDPAKRVIMVRRLGVS